jgi:hypothetical protein
MIVEGFPEKEGFLKKRKSGFEDFACILVASIIHGKSNQKNTLNEEIEQTGVRN